ncbi:MAG: class IV adenylate cyclase [Phycisphaerales bacterium]|nr:class IV adenylate cyclase [Phycisphaerales bacterium]
MPMQNVEYKAELRDVALARTIAASIRAISVDTLRQTDTYYRVPDAKLKKRETEGQPTEWVFYSRANRTQSKLSNFTLYPDSMARERFGSTELPVWVVVRKLRELWTYQGVRIHLDQVEGLGNFVEFEALICPERSMELAHQQVEFLRQSFGPAMGEPIACGYADLLEAERA